MVCGRRSMHGSTANAATEMSQPVHAPLKRHRKNLLNYSLQKSIAVHFSELQKGERAFGFSRICNDAKAYIFFNT